MVLPCLRPTVMLRTTLELLREQRKFHTEKNLAIMMSQHPRLGALSPMRSIDADLLRRDMTLGVWKYPELFVDERYDARCYGSFQTSGLYKRPPRAGSFPSPFHYEICFDKAHVICTGRLEEPPRKRLYNQCLYVSHCFGPGNDRLCISFKTFFNGRLEVSTTLLVQSQTLQLGQHWQPSSTNSKLWTRSLIASSRADSLHHEHESGISFRVFQMI